VRRQGAQQVAGGVVPAPVPAELQEGLRQDPLILDLAGHVGAGVQQGLVECLVEQPEGRALGVVAG
jgi:hypothetical protein